MLRLIIELHKHSTIYFSILFFFISSTSVWLYTYLFIVLHIAVYVFTLYCAIWSYSHKIE